jgi:cleavage stimulation factor subunit 2
MSANCDILTVDVATAATAVRNLNNYDLGTRQLRVDFSEKDAGGGRGSTRDTDVSHGRRSANTETRATTNHLPPLPEGKLPPAGVSIPNAISQTLQAYPSSQLADIISQLKAVATNNPEQGPFLSRLSNV